MQCVQIVSERVQTLLLKPQAEELAIGDGLEMLVIIILIKRWLMQGS